MKILFLITLVFSLNSANAANISDYSPASDLVNLTRVDGSSVNNVSTIYSHDGNMVALLNGGGRLMYRTDLADPSTSIREVNSHMGGCGDIEGGVQLGNYNLYANEQTPATIFVMPGPDSARKCIDLDNPIETFTLVDMDEFKKTFGVEGITILPDGRIVVVKEAVPERVAVFNYVAGTASYTPVDLFTVRSDCNRLGDIAISPEGNIVVICKSQRTLQEYTIDGEFIAVLPIPEFPQAEGLMFSNGILHIVGEPNHYRTYSATPPVYETCELSGSIQVDIINNNALGSATVTCPGLNGAITIDSDVF